LGTFSYNLRFPGQYYQAETGLNQNWNRDYDPLTGKYVESDPIGLHGGINPYTYVAGNPPNDADPFGLFRKGRDISDADWQSVQQAEKRIRDELRKSCMCHADGSGGCIPCDRLDAMLSRLNLSFVDIGHVSSDECGIGNLGGWAIWLSPDAFTGKGCYCLTSVLYHELLHNSGYAHDGTANDPNNLERKCLGSFCQHGKFK
jgi:RHS repeat-associated protein